VNRYKIKIRRKDRNINQKAATVISLHMNGKTTKILELGENSKNNKNYNNNIITTNSSN